MQAVPLSQLTPHETKLFTLDLLKSFDIDDSPDKKPRGQLVVELTFDPFKLESDSFGTPRDELTRKQSIMDRESDHASVSNQDGVLLVSVISAKDVEGEHHTNPYVQIMFAGEKKKTKVSHFLLNSDDNLSLILIDIRLKQFQYHTIIII